MHFITMSQHTFWAARRRVLQFSSSVVACAVLVACGGNDGDVTLKPNRQPFPLVEATVASFHAAMRNGDVSCRDVVEGYLARIAAYR